MLSLIGFLIVLAPLVFVHEFGHFIFARLFKVRAEAFSIGFGPRLFSKQIGETEWKLSLIPLGGYVKLLGEDPEQPLSDTDRPFSLQSKEPWKRFLIFLGGPLFNFIWAILVFVAILMIGEPSPTSKMGRIVESSPAYLAGLRSGDRITKVNNVNVTRFEEVLKEFHKAPNQKVTLNVERGTTSLLLNATLSEEDSFSEYGEEKKAGFLDGIYPMGRALEFGVSNLNSPAGKMGIRTGDSLIALNGVALKSFEEFEDYFSKLKVNEKFTLRIQKKIVNDGIKDVFLEFEKTSAHDSLAKAYGLYSTELFIDQVMPGSPASKANLNQGDRIAMIQGQPVSDFFSLKDRVQKAGESQTDVLVEWEREGKMIRASIPPEKSTSRDPLLKKVHQYTIGIMPMLKWAEAESVVERSFNPFYLIPQATYRMFQLTERNLVSIGKMIRGEVSVKTLGGPILIGKLAGESISRGLLAFLSTMAVLSVGLGVLNLLPIPVLDGGHIMLLGVEVIRKRPLSVKQIEIVQTVGFAFIMLLMLVVMKNDITRLPFFNS